MKVKIEALQAGKTDVGTQHILGNITDAGVPAAKKILDAGESSAARLRRRISPKQR